MKAVVIGTGAGGLTAAAYLAQDGFEVTALERGQQFGGYLNPFKRKKFEFDPGVHYVGRCRPGQGLYEIYEGLGVDAEELFAEMDPEGFDIYRFPGFEIAMCVGLERYRDRLIDAFPHERKGVDRFIGAVRQFDELTRVLTGFQEQGLTWKLLTEAAHGLPLSRWIRSTYREFLDWCVDDPRLADVLAAPCGDYGLPPSRASALVALALTAHYADGGFFPRGGSRAMRDALVGAARSAGATFHRNSEVSEIVVSGGRAIAVKTEDGREFAADVVISAVEPRITFEHLLPADVLPRRLRKKSANLDPSISSVCLFFGMHRDLRDHGFGAFNVWDYPAWDVEAVYEAALHGRVPDDPMLFLSPNSLKDPTGSLAPSNASTLEVVTLAPYEFVKDWGNEKSMMRSSGYGEAKDRVTEQITKSLERRYPNLIGDVQILEVSTPASNSHYVNSIDGGIYGPASTPGQSMLFRFRPQTPVANVWLAGSGVIGPGVLASQLSGRLAARLAGKFAHKSQHAVRTVDRDQH